MYPISNDVKALFESEQKQILRITGGEKSPISKSVGPSTMASFSDAIAANALNLSVGIEPVQSGSGDPSPTNVRPISGWTWAKVTRTGKNYGYFPPTDRSEISGVAFSVSNGELNISGTASANAYPNDASRVTQYASMPLGPYPAGTYTIKATGFIGQNAKDRIVCSVRYADNTAIFDSQRISGSGSSIPDGSGRAITFTATKPFKVGFWPYITSGTSIDCNVKLMMNLGTEPESYEPYQGETYDITFPSEAGTVYGGTLDVTTGLLTVEWVKQTFDGSDDEKWWAGGWGGGYRYLINISPLCSGVVTDIKFNYLFTLESQSDQRVWGGKIYASDIIDTYWPTSITTVSKLRAYLASNNLEVVYKLATPVTYQLTPTQIALLEGVNNVWVDCGDVTVEYATGYEYEINITDADVVIGSFNIDRFSCIGNKLEVGTATSAQMTVKLDNYDGRFNGIVFEGTELFVEIGIADWTQSNPTVHWMPCGYFTPDEQPRTRDIITIHALDRMMRFDAVPPVMTPWVTQGGEYVTDSQGNIIYFLSNVQFPITVQNLVKRVAMLCGVPFSQSLTSLPNYNYTIASMPTLQQQVTFRNLIQWCAGIMGANAWIDWTGSLRFSWYGASTGYTSTTANRFSSDLNEDDIIITGVQYTNTQGVTIVSGTDDYAIDLTGNYLVAAGIATILPNIKNARNGFTYRPFTASVINAPYLWPLDMITFEKDGINYTCALTNVNFGINGAMAVESKGETAQTNSGTAPSGVTTEQARLIEQAYEVANNLDKSLDQEGVFNRLTNNGTAQGIYIIDGQVYVNMSYARSGTLVLGGLNNRNGLLQLEDSAGNIIGQWNNGGAQIYSGFLDLQNGSGHLSTKTQINKDYSKQFYTEFYSDYTGTTSTTIGSGAIQINNSANNSSASIRPQGLSLISTYNDSGTDYPYIKLINSSKNTSVNIDAYGITISKNSIVWFSLSYEDNNPYMTVHGDVEVYGNLYASGAKPRLVSTDDYSERFLYCYETPTPLFGDVGEGTIGEDGRCYIWLDPVFAQTITTADYQVFLQRYGNGDCWIAERKPNCFVVEGTPGLTFGWELKARQRDFDQFRLEKNDKYSRKEHNYGADAALYIDSLKKERVSI